MEAYLKELQKKISAYIEAEKKIQKRCEGPGSDNLAIMSMGKMMAYNNCIKEVNQLIAQIKNVKDTSTSFF
jgi:hypothetical protein